MEQVLLLQALDITVRGASSHESCVQALEYVGRIRRSVESWQLFVTLLSNDEPNDYVIFLVLSLACDWISCWVPKLSESEKVRVRNDVVQLILLLSQRPKPFSRIVHVRLSMLLSTTAEHLYPQYWENFILELADLWTSSSLPNVTLQVTLVTALFDLLTDCVDTSFTSSLSSCRKQEIFSAFQQSMEPILDLTFKFLCHNVEQYHASCSSGCGGDVFITGGNAALQLLKPLVIFARPEKLITPAHDFFIVVELLESAHMQVAAVEFVRIAARCKLSEDLFVSLLTRLLSVRVSTMPEDAVEAFLFQVVYAESVFGVLAFNAAVLARDAFTSSPPIASLLEHYMGLLLSFSKLPSLALTAAVLSDWVKIFREVAPAALLKFAWLNDVAGLLLTDLISKLNRPVSREDSELHEASVDIASTLPQALQNGAVLLTQAIAAACPRAVVVCLGVEASRLISSAAAPSEWRSFHVMFDTAVTKLVEIYSEGKRAISERDEAVGYMRQIVEMLLSWNPPLVEQEALQAMRQKALASASRALGFFPHIVPLVIEAFFTSLTTTSTDAGAGIPKPQNRDRGRDSHYRNSILDARQRAAAGVSQLCSVYSLEIISSTYLDTFITQASAVLDKLCQGSSCNHHSQESTSLLTALVILANRMYKCAEETGKDIISGNRALRQQADSLMAASLGPVVAQWQQAAADLSASPDSMLAAAVAHKHAPGVAATSSTITLSSTSSFHAACNALTTLFSVAKHVPAPVLPDEFWLLSSPQEPLYSVEQLQQVFPFAAVWTDILWGVLSATGTLHAAWSLDSQQGVISRWPEGEGHLLYSPSVNQISQLTVSHPVGNVPLSLSDQGDILQQASARLLDLRRQIYQLLGVACEHKFLYCHPNHESFVLALASSIPDIDNAHLALFAKHVAVKYIVHSPAASLRTPASHRFLAAFFASTHQRLSVIKNSSNSLSQPQLFSQTIALYTSCGLSEGHLGLNSEQVELVRELIITDLRRIYADTLSTLLGIRGPLALPAGVSDSEIDADASLRQLKIRRSSLQDVMLSSADVALPLMRSVVILIGTSDSQTSRAALVAAEVLLAWCCCRVSWRGGRVDEALLSGLGTDAFAAALSVVVEEAKWAEGQEWLLNEFMMKCYCLLVLGVDVSAQAAAATSKDKTVSGWEGQSTAAVSFGGVWVGASSSVEGSSLPSTRLIRLAEAVVSEHPRRVLLSAPGVTQSSVLDLESALLTAQSKKKRRDVFRDFVREIVKATRAEQAHTQGDRESERGGPLPPPPASSSSDNRSVAALGTLKLSKLSRCRSRVVAEDLLTLSTSTNDAEAGGFTSIFDDGEF